MTRTRVALAVPILVAVLGAAHVALAESRLEREVARLAERLAIGPGSVVADVGAGKGEIAVELARLVGPGGRVYATELDPDLRSAIAERAKDAGLANVVVVEAQLESTGLPDACCDALTLRGVYHHLSAPEPILASIGRALSPRGRFVVIDFRPTRWLALWTPKDVPADRGGHGVPPEVVSREAKAAGFEQTALDEDWPASRLIAHYALTFEKR
jgi:ubiquinone/menaquinone biosynthesis C-methylase UbiE